MIPGCTNEHSPRFHRVGEEGDDIRGATLHQPSFPPLGGLGPLVLDLPQVAPKLA